MTDQEAVAPRAPAACDGGKRLSEDAVVASAALQDGEAPLLTDPDAVDTSLRAPAQRSRTFIGILVNTAAANITTSYLWFALTFWVYLETRNVIATGVVGGAYMLLIALSSISFGTFVDRYRKLAVMRFAAAFTLVMFVLALSTTVTILIEPDRRANANGLVGMVQGLMFIVTSVLSGLSVGLLGMGWTIAVALMLTALAFVHLLTLRMPEEVRAAATDAHGSFDLRGSLAVVLAISGLFALILFSTFNNFIGGVYMALMDPYGLEMFPVELWGIALVFLIAGIIMIAAALLAFLTPVYCRVLKSMPWRRPATLNAGRSHSSQLQERPRKTGAK